MIQQIRIFYYDNMKNELRVSKFCMGAGFLSVVEFGQDFMTKDNGEQIYAKACREDTLPRNDGSSQSRETQKFDPCWNSRPVACMVNMEFKIRIWSLS